MNTQFIGEQLLPGRIGQFFVILSFGTALLSSISYYFATVQKNQQDHSWQCIARMAFACNLLAIIGIACALFYIIYNHLFEYHYAWAHASKALPIYYIISCFWEGQEGSFWLWIFWQGILGAILFRSAKSWENPVMAILMLSQTFLTSMLIGVELFGTRIGSSPFILLRQAVAAPIFSRPDYLSLVLDGNGLNPLLQNYWMVIHPPTLFLGFASMVVPFAYAAAGLWQKRYKKWLKPALPWALFAVMILGTGIVMGSFWAYEALNFGGFWAWDPVENVSIIPWLTLIAAIHVMIAYQNSGHSYFTAVFLVLISFVLVLYASFLTRSGILGDTSVHAFTDLGMFWHLVIFILAFLSIAIFLLVQRWKELPITKKDEETYSREFWLFVGALVLTIACVQISVTTSIPVFNAIFHTNIAPPTNLIQHYNQWQAPFAIVIAFLSAFTQFLSYKQQHTKFLIRILITLVLAMLVTAPLVYITSLHKNTTFILLTYAAVFSMFANTKILAEVFKNKWRLSGSSIAHIGFALLLLGALVAAATSKVISVNMTGLGFGEEFEQSNNSRENILLYQDDPVKMDPYTVTYLGDSTIGVNTYYRVNYIWVDEKTGKIKEKFDLYPYAQQNVKMKQIIASPDTRHFLFHDLYTHVSSVPLQETAPQHEGEHEDEGATTYEVNIGDTIRIRDGFIIVKAVNHGVDLKHMSLATDDVAIALKLQVHHKNKVYAVAPIYLLKNGTKFDFEKNLAEAGLKLRFSNVYPEKDKLELMVYQKPEAAKKWIVIKAIQFSCINFFWGGAIIMIFGFLIAIFRRNKELKMR